MSQQQLFQNSSHIRIGIEWVNIRNSEGRITERKERKFTEHRQGEAWLEQKARELGPEYPWHPYEGGTSSKPVWPALVGVDGYDFDRILRKGAKLYPRDQYPLSGK